MNEFRIFGPPGTGKTTRLTTRDIPRAVEKFGPDGVMVTSFTKTAATEIGARIEQKNIPINLENVGTLHAICYRALGRPEIAERHLKEWNGDNSPLQIAGEKTASVDEGGVEFNAGGSIGDEIFSKINLFRARLIPEEKWPQSCRTFYKKWKEWKDQHNFVDFADMISLAHEELPYAPGNPQVLFVDEAQDNTPAQLQLCRSWGNKMPWFVFCGDDDQTLFQFTGATPDAFLNPPIDPKFKTVLTQSYRVPAAIHKRALSLIRRVRTREPKDYLPTAESGRIENYDTTWKNPDEIVALASSLAKSGESVMILASCSFMLETLVKILRDYGVPFYNPYRRSRGDWNPLGGDRKGISSSKILSTFLGAPEGFWNVPDFLVWAKQLAVGDYGLRPKIGNRAIKALEIAVENQEEGLESCEDVLSTVLSSGAVEAARNRDLAWLTENLKGERKGRIQYPLKVYKSQGIRALHETPKIIVGTIHSVKGGEADNVILFPDISSGAANEREETLTGRDSVTRMFYVGLTRARHRLVLCSPAQTNKQFRQLYEDL